jgi:hypothetical protein
MTFETASSAARRVSATDRAGATPGRTGALGEF